jgi:molecular chaperone DnaK (HSP70)
VTGSRSVIGVDFGTSTSLVAEKVGAGRTEVFALGTDTSWVPSVAAFDDGHFIVGEDADAFDDAVRSVKRAITENRALARPDSTLAADDVAVAILAEVLRRASSRMSTSERVLLGCPAMWDGAQRLRLLGLAQRAGLDLSLADLIDEPVAAGFAWLTARRVAGSGLANGRVLVFDMGGGTLDVAALDVRDSHAVSVMAAMGVAEAGDRLDEAIAEDLEAELARQGVDVSTLDNPARARGRLRLAARTTKVALSTSETETVVLPRRQFGVSSVTYHRKQLEELFAPQLDRAMQYVLAALRMARLPERLAGSTYDIMRLPAERLVGDICAVVLAGGMSRIPYVTQRLREFFPHCPIEYATDAPDESVVIGLADSTAYERVNMFRPGFDIAVEWTGPDGPVRRPLYQAYTPLYQAWQVAQGGADLCYRRDGLDLGLPRGGHGRLRAWAPSGERVAAGLAGQPLDGFPVALSEQDFDFRIYCDGRIRMVDGNGPVEGHVQGWQPIRARDHEDRVDRRAHKPEPEIRVYYPFDRERND